MHNPTPYRYQQAKRVTLLGALINFLLSVFKIIFGWLGHSNALLADGVHSLSDLVTDFLVLFAAKAGSQGPDQDHPYGHGRIETIVTVGLALFLIAVGIGIVVDAVLDIAARNYYTPAYSVLVVAAVSVLANEFLYRITVRTANKIHSELLRANAWHSRADAFSSLIVLLGAGATRLGFHYMDAVAAIIVAAMIIKMGVKMAWQSTLELVDTGLDSKQQEALIAVLKETPGVVAVHQMRSRSMAGHYLIDVHLQVAPELSVSEGHFIAELAYKALRQRFSKVQDITIHIDAEDDETHKPSINLPTREQLTTELDKHWHNLPGWGKLIALRLDYLNGKLYIHLVLPLELLSDELSGPQIQQQYRETVAGLPFIAGVNLNFQP